MREGWAIGVDGGGTRTRYLLVDAEGREVGRLMGPGTLLAPGGEEEVAGRLSAGISRLAETHGARLPIDSVCAGLAGAAGHPEAARRVAGALLREGVARGAVLLSDAQVAFADAFGAGAGLLLIAGTGSVAVGWRGGEGAPRLERVGGWGALLGDEGSGYWIGLQGIQRAILGREGRGSPTALTERLLSRIGAWTPPEIFAWADGAGKEGFAALAPDVLALGATDGVAGGIRAGAVTALLAHVEALAEALFPEPPRPPVALVGGLISEGGELRQDILDGLAKRGFAAHTDQVDPARGAARLALAGAPPGLG